MKQWIKAEAFTDISLMVLDICNEYAVSGKIKDQELILYINNLIDENIKKH